METTTWKVGMGDKVGDIITGAVGIVIGRVEYINGCKRMEVQPQKIFKDSGLPVESILIDEQQLNIIEPKIKPLVKPQTTKSVGGPRYNTCKSGLARTIRRQQIRPG